MHEGAAAEDGGIVPATPTPEEGDLVSGMPSQMADERERTISPSSISPSRCQITRAFDRNLNSVTDNVYEDENVKDLTITE